MGKRRDLAALQTLVGALRQSDCGADAESSLRTVAPGLGPGAVPSVMRSE